jgi:hypothetical protein
MPFDEILEENQIEKISNVASEEIDWVGCNFEV